MSRRDLFIAGRWRAGRGEDLVSHDPATGGVLWHGHAASDDDVADAVEAARTAYEPWSEAAIDERIELLSRFGDLLDRQRDELAESISRETGKPLWESRSEVATMVAKIPVSIDAYRSRCAEIRRDLAEAEGKSRFRPHGVVAVVGPFNLPGHLPNGHVVPALLAGNTVVLKQSERAPLVGEKIVALWQSAGAPPGTINLLQGAARTARALIGHTAVDGVLFTGSAEVGLAIRRMLVDRPQTIVALEMGGNNPLVVHEVADLLAAACLTVESAFLTAGQRCTCARRLIVPLGAPGDAFLEQLIACTRGLRVGAWNEQPEPFSGPVIDDAAARRVLDAQSDLAARGGRILIEVERVAGKPLAMLRPGLVDVTSVANRADREIFGPLLQVVRTRDFDHALAEARATAFGLAAGLLSDRPDLYERFRRQMRAGVINWNRPTTGAASSMPFGGVGKSGNHRPSGFFAADYCSYPVASIEAPSVKMPAKLPPGLKL